MLISLVGLQILYFCVVFCQRTHAYFCLLSTPLLQEENQEQAREVFCLAGERRVQSAGLQFGVLSNGSTSLSVTSVHTTSTLFLY